MLHLSEAARECAVAVWRIHQLDVKSGAIQTN
jgi:hypothetical protein